MRNYQPYKFDTLLLLMFILLLEGCYPTTNTPDKPTQQHGRETTTSITGVKRKAPIEVEIVSEEEFKDIAYAMTIAEKKVKQAPVIEKKANQSPAQDVDIFLDGTREEKEECGCSRTFQEYSSFPGGSYSYYTCAYHEKKEKEERNKKERIADEHKAYLKSIKTINMEPLLYAIVKYQKSAPRWDSEDSIRRTLLNSETMKSLFEITKKSNRWFCSKERVDAVNFALLDTYVKTTASSMWGGWREMRRK